MRIAVIADIHGNHAALEAVLADIRAQGADLTVNLGDHLSGPLEARRTADLLIGLGLPSVRGNHDRWLVEREAAAMGPSDRAALAQLDRRHLDWLAALPPTLTVEGEILLCHGTPASDTTYWLEAVTAEGVPHLASVDAIAAAAAGIDLPVILCGHTHIPRAVRLPDGRLIVNPGSVGCPGYEDDTPVPHAMQAGTPDASYALLDRRDGRWRASFRQVPYDHMAMAALARRAGRPDWERALATGWMR